MAQTPSRFCPQCGVPVEAGQRFCTNCGATMNIGSNNPTTLAGSDLPGYKEQASTVVTPPAHNVQSAQPGQGGPDTGGTLPTTPSSGMEQAGGPVPPYPVFSPVGVSNGGNPYASS